MVCIRNNWGFIFGTIPSEQPCGGRCTAMDLFCDQQEARVALETRVISVHQTGVELTRRRVTSSWDKISKAVEL